MVPSIGRIVHYVSHGTPVRDDGSQAFTPQYRAAVVTEVDEGDPNRVGLAVINPTGMFFHSLAEGGCVRDDAQTAGTWHWPQRVQ